MISNTYGVDIEINTPTDGPTPGATFSFLSSQYAIAGGIATLPDRSGNGLDAIQATAGNQPSASSSGFGTNSRAYITFDNTDDFLDIADNALLECGAGSFLLVWAGRLLTGGTYRCPVAKGSDTVNTGQRFFFTDTGILQTYANGPVSYTAAGFGVATGADRIAVWGLDTATNQTIYTTNSNAIARAAAVVISESNSGNPMRLGRDNTPSYQTNMRLAQLEFFNIGVGVGISDDFINAIINRYKIYHGI